MGLHGPVDHLAGHAGGHHLDHGDLGLGHLVACHVHQPGGFQGQQAGHVDLAAGFGNALLRHGLLGHGLAKGYAAAGALAHQLQRALGQANEAHAVVDAPGAQAPLGDLEATAFAQQDVGDGHAHVFKRHLHMAVGGVVVAEHVERANDLDAGGVSGHQHHALLRVLGRIGVALAHGDEHSATWVGRARNPPLATIDDVFVALAFNAGFDVGGVARSHGRFSHGEGRANLAFEQWLEPAGLVLFTAVTGNGFHIAGVRCRAVEHFAGPWHAAHDFCQGRIFLVGEACACVA